MTAEQTPDTIGDAARRTCILARIHAKALSLNRTDKDASAKAISDADSVRGAARVVVSRLPGADEHHKRITKHQVDAQRALARLSMPYGTEDAWRLLPNANWQALMAQLAAIKAEYDKAKAALVADAPTVIAKAKVNRGDFKVEVPTVDELTNAYDLKTEFRPVHDGRFPSLPPQLQASLEKHAAQRLAGAVEEAQRNTLERFVEPLRYFVERMEKFDQRLRDQDEGKEVGREGVFRDSVVENVLDLVNVAGSLNITGDPRLEELRERLSSVPKDADELRTDYKVRGQAMETARAALKDLQDWLG